MDEYQNSDSEYITDESSSFEEEDYEVYKKVEMDVSQMGNQNEIIIEITNNKSNQKSDYQFEQITDLIFKIEDDNVIDDYYCKLISSFKKIRSIKFQRDLKFLTCTKSIKLAYNMLRSIDLSQVEEINLTLPIKDSYTDQFSAEQKQNAIWDGDDDTMQEKMQIEKEKEKSKKEATAKKNKEKQLVEKEKLVKANKYEIFQNILQLIQSSCFKLTHLSLIMNSWYCDDLSQNNFQQVFDLMVQILVNNANSIQAFHLNAFQWGFYNNNFKSSHFDQIAYALLRLNPENLQELTLDFGRWGCEEYKNNKLFRDQNILLLAKALSNFKNLNYLQLNFRSWAYDNVEITDHSVISLFSSISLLQKLVVLNLEVSRWKYQNKNITLKSLSQIGVTLLSLKKIKLLTISLKTWQIIQLEELVAVLKIHQATLFMPSLRKEPKIIIEDYYYHCLSEQLCKIKDLQKQIIAGNKKILYSFKSIQQQYQKTFRQEIIWHVTQLCCNFDNQLLEKQIKECMSLQNVQFNRNWWE